MLLVAEVGRVSLMGLSTAGQQPSGSVTKIAVTEPIRQAWSATKGGMTLDRPHLPPRVLVTDPKRTLRQMSVLICNTGEFTNHIIARCSHGDPRIDVF
jgi:hypothetical protein